MSVKKLGLGDYLNLIKTECTGEDLRDISIKVLNDSSISENMENYH